MTAGIILLNFGEPEEPTLESVVPFLERIFLTNAGLEGKPGRAEARRRSRELAERRAPGLIEEYQEIGGSPLNRQAAQQAEALAAALRRRGHDVRTYLGMQFTEPTIAEAVNRARSDGADRLIGLPVYPLCGPSTTVAALAEMERAVRKAGWDVPVREISGWHRHPDYLRLRADAILHLADEEEVDLEDPGTRLVFSIHGTPVKYLREGSRYEIYARECCAEVAALAGVERYLLGFQNHTNRPIEWTQPDVEDVIRNLSGEADRVVVDAISFMHEQSETLAELDGELREEAEEAGLTFHRVPVPHDDPRFPELLADLVEPLLEGGALGNGARQGEAPAVGLDAGPVRFDYGRCVCRPTARTFCLNAVREAASSPVT